MHLKIEKKLNKNFVLVVRGAFEVNGLSLYKINNEQITLLDEIEISSKLASKLLVSSIQKICDQNQVSLTDIFCIFADQGPGAFTTIRTTAATLNGISFQKKMSLIPFNSLEEITFNIASNNQTTNLIINVINAYGKQVFFCIYDQQEKCLIKTNVCTTIQSLINEIKDLSNKYKSILLTGNAIEIYSDEFKDLEKNKITYLSSSKLNEIGLIKKKINEASNADNKIFPIYIKPGF